MVAKRWHDLQQTSEFRMIFKLAGNSKVIETGDGGIFDTRRSSKRRTRRFQNNNVKP